MKYESRLYIFFNIKIGESDATFTFTGKRVIEKVIKIEISESVQEI